MTAEDEIATEEYEEPEGERRRRAWLPWLVLLLVLLLIAWLICRYSDLGRAPDVEDVGAADVQIARVPDVVGLSNAEAAQVLEAAGFTVDREVSFDALATPDTVVSQDPPAGERAAAGSTVFIAVAAETLFGNGATADDDSDLRVPNVVGLGRAEARAALEAKGFGVSISEVYSASVPEDQVADQTPAPGALATPGDTVGVIISLGGEPESSIPVPRLVGLTRSAAVARIRAAGLEPRVMYQPMPSAVGLVYQQSPEPGTAVPADRYVFVLVGARP